MVNTVNSSATTVAVGTVTEEILMEVDFCRERLRVGGSFDPVHCRRYGTTKQWAAIN